MGVTIICGIKHVTARALLEEGPTAAVADPIDDERRRNVRDPGGDPHAPPAQGPAGAEEATEKDESIGRNGGNQVLESGSERTLAVPHSSSSCRSPR